MSTKIPVSIAGNLVADPELSIGESGVAHAKLRVAVNQRIQGADGTWRDGEPVFHNVSAFRALAENAATSLKKGDPVTVAGELEFRSYEKDGERREARRIVADTIGPDLRFGTAVYQRSSHVADVGPSAQVHVGPKAPIAAASAPPAYNLSSKSPVAVPPFGKAVGTEMSF
ncbi:MULTISPECIES: single-stranded DNA-binding protein [unclassified Arthrobacter]|uniref:single-stranded DNA-binding protein n=1 Tax=unclassified Arthrobacter TaxID=235627 RepID=UPI002E072D57|nr:MULTISPECIES: single-stranded DNA-binding protein [unclassified Arthrobacter]MEC5193310.1 single-strand DNA-binding protein [Arthrobacter sp. MP_M4]MEC5204776.1 single-strand DNA-binding protein [Arthrobacter sp. MP_M7]